MINKKDCSNLFETIYLLRSSVNAKELFKGMKEADENMGIKIDCFEELL